MWENQVEFQPLSSGLAHLAILGFGEVNQWIEDLFLPLNVSQIK